MHSSSPSILASTPPPADFMPHSPLRASFLHAVAAVRGLSPGSFDRWFSAVQLDDVTDGVVSLRAKDTFVRDWVADHYLPSIVARFREESQLSVQIAWTFGAIESPLAEAPSGDGAPPSTSRVRVRPSVPPSAGPVVTAVAAPPPAAGSSSALDPAHLFSAFVVGPSNDLAHAAALAVAGGGGRRYSPLFLCGGAGLGKTHLLHAIGHEVLATTPGRRVVYVSAEHFTNEFIQSIQLRKMDAFRRRYREECDLLLVDDVQFLAGREQTQEEFFHTFNALLGRDKPIVLSSDKYPAELERVEERLVSRFASGLVADMRAPELETRVAILKKKAAAEALELPDDVAVYLAQSVSANVRELEGALIRLSAKSSLTGAPLDLALARSELAAVGVRPRITSFDEIQRVVCHHFHLRAADLVGKDRHKTVALARHLAMFVCKEKLRVSFPEIGRAFGKDHTTVISAVRKVEGLRERDPEVRAHLSAITKRLSAG